MPGISEQRLDRNGSYKSLQSASANNATGMVWYRADYELRWLRKSRRECVKIGRLMKRCRTFKGYAELSRALLEWCERERILLHIKLPGVEHPREQQAQSSKSPTIYEVSPSTAPSVMHDAGPGPGPASEPPADSTPAVQP